MYDHSLNKFPIEKEDDSLIQWELKINQWTYVDLWTSNGHTLPKEGDVIKITCVDQLIISYIVIRTYTILNRNYKKIKTITLEKIKLW
jgi:hypothetical protein